MRLWHIELLPYLPKSQLLSQKREIDLIWKDIKNGKQTNHILINYIWEYEDFKERLYMYYLLLEKEFIKRNFKFNDNAKNIIKNPGITRRIVDPTSTSIFNFKASDLNPFPIHHNFRYLTQCFYNLQEKYDRGQIDFSEETYNKLKDFYSKEFAKGVI